MYQSQLIDALSEKSKALNEVLASLKKNGESKTISLKDGTRITGESGNNGFTFIIKRNNTVVKKQSYKSLPSTNTLQSDFKTALEASILGDAKIKQSAPAKQEAPTAEKVISDLEKILAQVKTPPEVKKKIETTREELKEIIEKSRDWDIYISVERKRNVYDPFSDEEEAKYRKILKECTDQMVSKIKALPYVRKSAAISVKADFWRVIFAMKAFPNPFKK